MDHSTKAFNKTYEELISRDRENESRYFIREQIAGKDNIQHRTPVMQVKTLQM